MIHSHRVLGAPPALLAGALLLCAPLAAARQAAGPFEPGLRWQDSSDTDQPWIPRDVAFAGQGELVWAAPVAGSPHVALYPAGELGPSGPSAVDTGFAGAISRIEVEGGAGSGDLFAMVQLPAPDALSRRTRVSLHDRLGAATGQGLGPLWTYEFGALVSGNARLARSASGGPAVLAVFEKEQQRVALEWLDPASGQVLTRTKVPGQGLQALSVALGGQRLALVAGLELWVLNSDGALLHHETLSSSTEALALSEDGQVLAVGGFSALRLLRWDGSDYLPALTHSAAPELIATRTALSADGRTAAVGWWNFLSGTAVRLEVIDGQSGALLHQITQTGPAGGVQNYPEAVQLTADGRRIAFGLWGQGDAEPEVILLQRDAPQPLLEADLQGSVYCLALDPTGTRVAVGEKYGHANQFGTTGRVLLLDTGERPLQVIGRPSLGGSLELAASAPGSTLALFLVGLAGPPLYLPGIDGPLQLDPSAPLVSQPVALDAGGRGQLTFGVPPKAALAGLELAVQALALGGSSPGFVGGRVAPVLQ